MLACHYYASIYVIIPIRIGQPHSRTIPLNRLLVINMTHRYPNNPSADGRQIDYTLHLSHVDYAESWILYTQHGSLHHDDSNAPNGPGLVVPYIQGSTHYTSECGRSRGPDGGGASDRVPPHALRRGEGPLRIEVSSYQVVRSEYSSRPV